MFCTIFFTFVLTRALVTTVLEFVCFDRQINVGPLLAAASAAPEDRKKDFFLDGAR